MGFGSIIIRTRPLRVAFLVDPNAPNDLYRAIEISTLMWGGSYNPIIPTYSRMPSSWSSIRGKRPPRPAEIIEGYLEGFDPDIVVPIGKCTKNDYGVGNREIIQESDLLGDISTTLSPRYGIGFIELLDDFLEKELKYKRNDDLHVAIPEMPRAYRTFLASILGALPKEFKNVLEKNFPRSPNIISIKPTLENIFTLWVPHRRFPRHLTSWGLDHAPLREPTLFVCDAKNTQDIIDFWNLRAAGYYVIPIPIQLSENENIRHISREFIEQNYRPYRHNPNLFHHTTVQKSRSLTEESVLKFCESLDIAKVEKTKNWKYSFRGWYPRLWDSWTRENASEGISFPYSHEEDRRISEGETRLDLRSLNPNLELSHEYSGKPRFANEFSFRLYGFKEPMAEVIPEGSRELSSAIGRTGYHNLRFSKSGPVFLANKKDDLIFLNLPLAESVMAEWFRERGWKISLSGPGRIATQLIKQLGGSFGINRLAHRGVIDLLEELENEAGLPWQAVIGKLKKIIAEDELYFDSERFLESLVESNALRLGAKIKCPICTRHNWFELNALKYELTCRFCLSDFKPPIQSPKDIAWTYRAHGPFASSTAQGSFTVLLTLSFLEGNRDCSITPLFSYTAQKEEKLLEADLTCLYKKSSWENSRPFVIHAECKSFNSFERRDISRMKEMADEFPGSVLIFSTLNESLRKSEAEMIRSLENSERRKRLRGAPYSPVIVLTGIELFSSRALRDCWKGRDGIYEKFNKSYFDFSDLHSLADATQQIYLNLKSWFEWSDTVRKKRKVGGTDRAK